MISIAAFLAVAGQASAQSVAPTPAGVVQLLQEHQYDQALSSADKLLATNSHSCQLFSLRGIALNGMHRKTEADQAFRRALKYCPNDLLALEGAAEIEYAGQRPGATELLSRILAIRPHDETAHAMLASLYRDTGKCEDALPHFEASRALLNSHPKFQQEYAFCLAKAGRYSQAAAVYKSVLESKPDDAARYNLAFVQWKLNAPADALGTLRPMLTADAKEPVLALGARVAEESNDTPLAVKLLRSAIVASPKNIANYLEFAQISFNHNSYQVGIDMINAGLAQLPKATKLYLARGVLEVQLSKSAEALADFERAHKLEPQLSLAMDAIGIVKSQQYKPAAALAWFGDQARQHPKDSLLQYLYAEALSDSSSDPGAAQKAIRAAELSVKLDPGYGPARDLLSLLWLRVGNPQRALEEAEAALRIRPNDDVALYHEIMARRRLGQTKQVEVLVKQLAAMRRRNSEMDRARHHYALQEGPGP